jgi:helicase MOV-10
LSICCLKSDGCLVLAGDPRQLGPVIQCEQLENYGRSLFERVFEFSMYKRDRASNRYDSSCITKLLHCYRCDPRVLEISNKLFYEDELICMDATPKSILCTMNLGKPIQCCHVIGTELQAGDSTSWLNEEEAEYCADLIVRLYKIGLEPDQIAGQVPSPEAG